MAVNNFKIIKSVIDTDKEIVIPVEMTWDFSDRSDALISFERNAIKEILAGDKDYEVARFGPKGTIDPISGVIKTEVVYNFHFVPSGATVNTASWNSSYLVQGFTAEQIYYYKNQFKKSFFKLDFYDSTDLRTQTNYLTIILPVQQGLTTTASVPWNSSLTIKKPVFILDYLGDQEGLFIYWLKDFNILKLDTLYMTAKFFDAKQGVFIKMMVRPQSTILGDKFNFPQDKYFYYRVSLDYSDYTYKIYDIMSGGRVGSLSNPINWYEYINP